MSWILRLIGGRRRLLIIRWLRWLLVVRRLRRLVAVLLGRLLVAVLRALLFRSIFKFLHALPQATEQLVNAFSAEKDDEHENDKDYRAGSNSQK